MDGATGLKRLLVLSVAAVTAASVGCSEGADPAADSPQPSGPSVAEAPTVEDVIAATTGGGDAKLRIDVQTRMPPDFDDGIPDRSFSGTGFLDRDKALAGVNYEMSRVPNSAGYFGQVDGEMNVFYSGSEWIVSFPLMASSLAGPLDWLSYDLALMADPRAQKLGIGQLREVGLADPRLGLALLEGADALQQGASVATPLGDTGAPGSPAPTPAGPAYRAAADVAGAAGAASELRPLLAGLQELGVTSVDLALTLDEEGRVGTLSYGFSYPPKQGSEPVEMRVTHTFMKYGLEGGLNPPGGRSVTSFRGYVGI